MRSLLDQTAAAEQLSRLDSQGSRRRPAATPLSRLARVRDDARAAAFAIVLEERAVGAYLEAVRNLADPNLLRTLAGAMGTDGQHLVVLRELARRPPVPVAFERGIAP